ncbi:uncharacterized protein LOC116065205, partial [Sander lucioperca]|uniref:uncharacterized protein LOC116065205 n=1 Tax=Sander lucioperca TaxID=283035 RepID=UPI001653B538
LQWVFFFCLFAGLQSGFVTLPHLSRIDRQFYDGDVRKGSLPDSGGFTLTCSDSLMSFTVDQTSNHSQAADEEEEGEDHSSLTETPVQSPELTSPNPSMSSRSFSSNLNNRGRSCSVDWAEEEEERGSLRTPDVSTGSPQRAEPVMEAERFQRAADVLSRHYGGGSFTKGTRMSNDTPSPALSQSRKTPYAFSEEEEEVKV